MYQENSMEDDFESLRMQCNFLITREKSGESFLLAQNEYFIKNLEKLFERKFLIPSDMLMIL